MIAFRGVPLVTVIQAGDVSVRRKELTELLTQNVQVPVFVMYTDWKIFVNPMSAPQSRTGDVPVPAAA
jgi:hypothetical protein